MKEFLRKFKTVTAALILVFTCFAALNVKADAGSRLSTDQLNFLRGFSQYSRASFGECADTMFALVGKDEPIASRARLYLALCQKELKLRDLAAFNLNQVDEDSLSPSERTTYERLSENLETEMDKLNLPFVTLVPYGGSISYSSSDPNRQSGTVYGAELDIAKGHYHGLLSAETVHLSIKNGYSDYSQTQWSVGLGRTSSEGFDLHARQIGISSDNTNYQGIAITNIGASQSWTSSQTSLGLDLYYSSYPNSTLGKLTAFEAALTGTQTFISDAKGGSFWGSIELESVMPTATVTQDPDSDFSLKSSYFRAALALNYFDLTNTYTAQYWAGSEAFGVRSGGAVVYSGNEEHTSGLSLKVSHAFDQTWSLQGSVGQENYKIGSTNASATVVTLAALIGI